MNYKPHHTAISVRDLDKSLVFYKLLGYEQVHRYDEEDNSMSIIHLKLGDSFLEIFAYANNKEQPAHKLRYGNDLEIVGVKHIALSTDDIKSAFADLASKGLVNNDTKITVGRTKVQYFFIQDPDGVWVEVVQDDRYQ